MDVLPHEETPVDDISFVQHIRHGSLPVRGELFRLIQHILLAHVFPLTSFILKLVDVFANKGCHASPSLISFQPGVLSGDETY